MVRFAPEDIPSSEHPRWWPLRVAAGIFGSLCMLTALGLYMHCKMVHFGKDGHFPREEYTVWGRGADILSYLLPLVSLALVSFSDLIRKKSFVLLVVLYYWFRWNDSLWEPFVLGTLVVFCLLILLSGGRMLVLGRGTEDI